MLLSSLASPARARRGASCSAWRSALAALGLVACSGQSPPPAQPSPTPPVAQAAPPAPPPAPSPAVSPWVEEAARGVSDRALADLLLRHWEWTMKTSPLWATQVGDHRYDRELPDMSPQAVQADRAAVKAFLDEARALPAPSDEADRVTLELFIEELDGDVASNVCDFQEWTVSVSANPLSLANNLPRNMQIRTAADGDAFLSRVEKVPGLVDAWIANLRLGLGRGLLGNVENVRRTLAMIDTELARPVDEWVLVEPVKAERPDWPAGAAQTFATRLRAAADGPVRDALVRFRDLLEKEIIPKARPDSQAGIASLPIGPACYAARIRAHTSLALDAEAVHQIGLRQIKLVNDEMRRLGRKLFRTGDLARIIERLRRDPKVHFDTADAIEAKANQALAAAKAKIPEFFGILPKANCVVRRIPDYEAPYTTVAYYRQPNPDGTKPGEYMINVLAPETRTRYEAEALAFHESIPGHHLQIAIAQELPATPAFRRHMGTTSFVEGWALYTEILADEMGLYSGDLDRMGMLSYQAWRASRLVVDTGMHSKGWSRAQAEAFMKKHTALAVNNVENEVDRYIGWPGQALAYKLGQLHILELRAKARKALGDKFDIRAFHDTVLSGGAVTLSVLTRRVDAWIAAGGVAAR